MRLLPTDAVNAEHANAGPSATGGRQLAAACGALLVAAELIVAPVTLGCTVVMIAISRLTRWSLAWLVLPAASGLALAGFEGPGRTVSGFVSAGAHIAALIAGPGTVPGHLARLPEAMDRWRAALAGQWPLASVTAAAQAAVVADVRERIGSRRLRTRRDAASQDNKCRPGPVRTVRRAYLTATLRRGEFATVDGACLAIARETGRRAVLTWAEAAGGVLVTGRAPAAVTSTGLDLAAAAIQHRKAVIVVDLSAWPGQVATVVAAACADVQAPLRIWPRTNAGVANAGQAALAEVLARRQVLLIRPASGSPDETSGLARLVGGWLTDALAERRALGVPADGLIWLRGCERAGRETLDQLLGCPSDVGIPIVFSTTSGQVAALLGGQVGAIVVRGPSPRGWPGRTAPGLPAELLAGRGDDELALLVRGLRPRLIAASQVVR